VLILILLFDFLSSTVSATIQCVKKSPLELTVQDLSSLSDQLGSSLSGKELLSALWQLNKEESGSISEREFLMWWKG
jgi:hypothetical protein